MLDYPLLYPYTWLLAGFLAAFALFLLYFFIKIVNCFVPDKKLWNTRTLSGVIIFILLSIYLLYEFLSNCSWHFHFMARAAIRWGKPYSLWLVMKTTLLQGGESSWLFRPWQLALYALLACGYALWWKKPCFWRFYWPSVLLLCAILVIKWDVMSSFWMTLQEYPAISAKLPSLFLFWLHLPF